MNELPDNETRHKIIEVAEALFSTRGYAAVKLRDIAEAVQMKHASLYYYVPGGKEQLFIEVFEHSFQRHQKGISQAIQQAGDSFIDQLYAVADWFATQPAMDLNKIQQGDRPDLTPEALQRLAQLAYDSLRLPIVAAIEQAQSRQQIEVEHFDLAAMALISMVQSTSNIPGITLKGRKQLGHMLIDMLMKGWLPR
jgi:AcrR family transcriptional regulator